VSPPESQPLDKGEHALALHDRSPEGVPARKKVSANARCGPVSERSGSWALELSTGVVTAVEFRRDHQ
jgi:hypothetical protein